MQQGCVALPYGLSRNPPFCNLWQRAFFQGGLLGTESDFGVAVRGLETRMPQPCADHVDLDSSFEKMYGG